MTGLAVDAAGNVYAGDEGNSLVVRVSSNGVVSVVAGNGVFAFSGDGGPAGSASLAFPCGLALDAAGNLYIADIADARVRKLGLDGIISTVAGGRGGGFSGDGGPAVNAQLNQPCGLAVDTAGNLYIGDSLNHRVRRVSPDGVITTVAGNGSAGFSGDGGPATAASLNVPKGLAVDSAGSLYIADSENHRVRKIPRGGVITTVAGSGVPGFSGDGGPAFSASMNTPTSLAVDGAGNLYVGDTNNARVRKVSAAGIMITVAGSGLFGFSGDGGPATSAAFALDDRSGVAVDAAGNLYIADFWNHRIRKVNPGGVVNTFAGSGTYRFSGDGGAGTAAFLNEPAGLALDAAGNLYIADFGNYRIRKLTPAGSITTIAGNGQFGYSGDNGPAVGASLQAPESVAVDATGNLYIADSRIRKVSPSGIITTVAGTEGCCPYSVAVDATGNLYITDITNHRVSKVNAAGVATTVAGNGVRGFSGDNGPATSAALNSPISVAVDSAGNVYIADHGNHRIRRVSASGMISTVAGNGIQGFSGDGGPAVSAALNRPISLAFDATGNLFFVDAGTYRVRRVSAGGTITTVAGSGVVGFTGDGGAAIAASFRNPFAVAVDSVGNIYVADRFNNRIRKVLAVAPAFAVAPAALSFTAPAGTPVVPTKQIATSSNLTGMAYRVEASTTDGAPWLSFSPPASLTPGPVSIGVNAVGLAPGNYQGTVTILAPLGATPMQTVNVQFVVTVPVPPQLVVEPAALNFEVLAGSGNPSSQALRITNAGDGVLNWTAQATIISGGNWLTLSQSSGTAAGASPFTVEVTANVAGLAAGVYSGAVLVQSSTTNQSVSIPVIFLITQPTPTILVSQTGLFFTAVQGGGVAPAQTFGILNVGQGTMSWTVDSSTVTGGNWLSVTPSTGTSTVNSFNIPLVDVAVNSAALSAGSYTGLIRVGATGARNTPQFVTVVLNVLPPGSNPGVLVRPTGLIFASAQGSSAPTAQTVKLATAAPDSLGFVSGLVTFDGGRWPETGTQNAVVAPGAATTLSVQPSPASLGGGVYRGTVALLFADGSSQNVNILFLVVPPGSQAAGKGAPMALACVPQQLLGVHRSLGSTAPASVGWPTNIEVQVVDNCGNAVSTATVVARFSNGDPPLVLNSLRNGTYTGTWKAVAAASQVVVSIRASLPPLTPLDFPPVQLQVFGNDAAPAVNAGGIVNAASFSSGEPLAPGGIISVFGRKLSTATGGASSVPLPTTLGGATLNIGGRDIPLFYSSGDQINAQLPFELTPNSRVAVVAKLPQAISIPEIITVGSVRPGIFTINQSGRGQGAILNVRGQLADSAAPAAVGEVIQVFATGLGATLPAVSSGQAAPGAEPLARVTTEVQATVGGLPAAVQFAGLAPGFVGLYQVNVQVPAGVTPGSAVPVILLQNGASNTVTIAVR